MLNRISKILENIENISEDDMSFLEKITVKYPYFHISHILYLKGLKQRGALKYSSYLEKTALVSPNRKALFEFLNSDYFLNKDCKGEVSIEKNEDEKSDSIEEEPLSLKIETPIEMGEESLDTKIVIDENEEIEKEKNDERDKNIFTQSLNIFISPKDIYFLQEIKKQSEQVIDFIENTEYTDLYDQKSIIETLNIDFSPLFLVYNSYMLGIREKENKFIIEDENIKNQSYSESLIKLKTELKIIKKSIPDYIEQEDEEFIKYEVEKIIEEQDFIDKKLLLEILKKEELGKSSEDIDYILLKMTEYKEYNLLIYQRYIDNIIFNRENYKDEENIKMPLNFIDYKKYELEDYIGYQDTEISKNLENIEIVCDYLLRLVDRKKYLPIKYIEKEVSDIKESIEYAESKDYLRQLFLLSSKKVEKYLIKLDLIDIELEQKKINIVFNKKYYLNYENIKLIKKYEENLDIILEDILDRNDEILDFVFLEEIKKDLIYSDYKENNYIKYINGRPIKKIDINSISKDENTYVNIMVLVDYYRKEIQRFFNNYQLIESLNYIAIDEINNIVYRIQKLIKNDKKDLLLLFVELFNVVKGISDVKNSIKKDYDLEKFENNNLKLIEIITKDLKYLKIAYIYYLKGREGDNATLKEGKNILRISFSKKELKLIEKNENVLLQVFLQDIERIEESFKRRFRILGGMKHTSEKTYYNNSWFNFTKDQEKQIEKEDLIEKFINSNITSIPKIKVKQKQEAKEEFKDPIINKDITNFATETLIEMYIKQKKYNLAIRGYKILLSQDVQKEKYYKMKIKEVEKLING